MDDGTSLPRVHPPSHCSFRPDRVRLTILMRRKAGMSAEDFSTYWREEHSQIFAKIAIVRKNLLKYEQVHVDSPALAKFKEVGLPTSDFDGMAIFEARDWDKIAAVFSDPEYREKVVPDEEKFVDRAKCVALPSHIVGVFDEPT